MNGPTVECMKVNGRTIKCMGKEFSLGETEEDTKASMSTIRKKDTEYLNGLTVEDIWGNGKMENSMGRELL